MHKEDENGKVANGDVADAAKEGVVVPDRSEVEKVVESFLAQRSTCPLPPTKTGVETVEKPDLSQPEPENACAVKSEKKLQKIEDPAVDFASEWEVRQALEKGATIVIDDNTILTPLARELGEREGVFVRRGSLAK